MALPKDASSEHHLADAMATKNTVLSVQLCTETVFNGSNGSLCEAHEGIKDLVGSLWFDNDNDNDNILFDHNLQIEITIYNSLENQIINTLVWKLLLRQNNLSLAQ